MMRPLALALALLWGAVALAEPRCEDVTHGGIAYTVCRVSPAEDDLTLFLRSDEGTPLGQFQLIERHLQDSGKELTFAMNAGMYHADRSPVGLYIENGRTVQKLITSSGPGNFGLLPNGVLCLRPGRADVYETMDFARRSPACTHATQSGPMLVINGKLHPRFLRDSTSRYVRNGVGTDRDGTTAVFAISNSPVTFYEFGSLFKEGLGLPNALYFDGNISRLHAPQIGRQDAGFLMGPVIGVVAPIGSGG